MLKIGEFSKLAQVSIKTLRYYAELGLFRPDWIDRYTGYRYYTLQQLPRLNRILTLKELGFPLLQIERMLGEDLTLAELQRMMRLRKAELEEQVRAEQNRLARVATRLARIEAEGIQPRYDVMTKQIPLMLVAGIRDTVQDDGDLVRLRDELRDYLNHAGIATSPLTPITTISYDAEYQDRGADMEIMVPLARRVRERGRVAIHKLPGIDAAASVVHHGSHLQLPRAYQSLVIWAQTNGYRIGAQSRTVYLQGWDTETPPEECVTELQLPVVPMSRTTVQRKEIAVMEPKIVEKGAFTVMGLPFTGYITSPPYADGEHNNEIGQVWDRLNQRVGEIKQITGAAYGVCFAQANDKEPWYLAGFEVDQSQQVPHDMMRMTVPAQKYAVFPCTLETLGETYRYIAEEWQPRAGYQHADGPDFECYDQEPVPEPSKMKLSVYWPIQ